MTLSTLPVFNRSQNKETVGWLYIPGTSINTPIVQHKDNDFYLTKNFYGSYTRYGCVYADYQCKRNTLSKNTVIYGHDMSCGTAFYDLNRYDDIEWYKKNPVIHYCTLNGNYTFLIYTAFLTTVDSKDDGGYMFNFIEPNIQTLPALLSRLTSVLSTQRELISKRRTKL